jgi:GNAT superfamily N-acetyltransferase
MHMKTNAKIAKRRAKPARLGQAPKIGLEPKPWGAVKRQLGGGLDRYNISQAGDYGDSEFIVAARDPKGRLLGGFYVVCVYETAFLKWAWVAQKARRLSVGSALMAAAEKEARRRKAKLMYLDTFSYQARPFYEKLGYSVFGILKLGRKGLERYWMSKAL